MGKAVIIEIAEENVGVVEALKKLQDARIINRVSENGMSFVARSEVNTSTLFKQAKKRMAGTSAN